MKKLIKDGHTRDQIAAFMEPRVFLDHKLKRKDYLARAEKVYDQMTANLQKKHKPPEASAINPQTLEKIKALLFSKKTIDEVDMVYQNESTTLKQKYQSSPDLFNSYVKKLQTWRNAAKNVIKSKDHKRSEFGELIHTLSNPEYKVGDYQNFGELLKKFKDHPQMFATPAKDMEAIKKKEELYVLVTQHIKKLDNYLPRFESGEIIDKKPFDNDFWNIIDAKLDDTNALLQHVNMKSESLPKMLTESTWYSQIRQKWALVQAPNDQEGWNELYREIEDPKVGVDVESYENFWAALAYSVRSKPKFKKTDFYTNWQIRIENINKALAARRLGANLDRMHKEIDKITETVRKKPRTPYKPKPPQLQPPVLIDLSTPQPRKPPAHAIDLVSPPPPMDDYMEHLEQLEQREKSTVDLMSPEKAPIVKKPPTPKPAPKEKPPSPKQKEPLSLYEKLVAEDAIWNKGAKRRRKENPPKYVPVEEREATIAAWNWDGVNSRVSWAKLEFQMLKAPTQAAMENIALDQYNFLRKNDHLFTVKTSGKQVVGRQPHIGVRGLSDRLKNWSPAQKADRIQELESFLAEASPKTKPPSPAAPKPAPQEKPPTPKQAPKEKPKPHSSPAIARIKKALAVERPARQQELPSTPRQTRRGAGKTSAMADVYISPIRVLRQIRRDTEALQKLKQTGYTPERVQKRIPDLPDFESELPDFGDFIGDEGLPELPEDFLRNYDTADEMRQSFLIRKAIEDNDQKMTFEEERYLADPNSVGKIKLVVDAIKSKNQDLAQFFTYEREIRSIIRKMGSKGKATKRKRSPERPTEDDDDEEDDDDDLALIMSMMGSTKKKYVDPSISMMGSTKKKSVVRPPPDRNLTMLSPRMFLGPSPNTHQNTIC